MAKDVSKMSIVEACQTHIKDATELLSRIESNITSFDPEFDACDWATVGQLTRLVELLEQAANV